MKLDNDLPGFFLVLEAKNTTLKEDDNPFLKLKSQPVK